jgi:hypothetical protein
MGSLPDEVDALVAELLAMLDERQPGGVIGFYLVGSLALGDYQPGRSDIDFVAVTSSACDPLVLGDVHAALARAHPGVHCDGLYLTTAELAAQPTGRGTVAREGRVLVDSPDERHSVTWLTLADHGVAVRGAEPSRDWIPVDLAAVAEYSRNNLQTYWRRWIDSRRRLLSPGGLSLLSDEAVTWGVLGVSRLYAAIAEGRILSKSAAGEHALGAFRQHAQVIEEAMRIRRGAKTSSYRSRFERRRDAVAFIDSIIGFEQ